MPEYVKFSELSGVETVGAQTTIPVLRNGINLTVPVSGLVPGLGLVVGVDVQGYDTDLITWAGITPGSGIVAALTANVGSTGAPVVYGGAGGTPSSLILTNATGLLSSGINDGAVTTSKIANGSVTSAKLSATGVTPGSYTSTNITVDEQGRISAAANGSGGGITTGKAIAMAIVFG